MPVHECCGASPDSAWPPSFSEFPVTSSSPCLRSFWYERATWSASWFANCSSSWARPMKCAAASTRWIPFSLALRTSSASSNPVSPLTGLAPYRQWFWVVRAPFWSPFCGPGGFPNCERRSRQNNSRTDRRLDLHFLGLGLFRGLRWFCRLFFHVGHGHGHRRGLSGQKLFFHRLRNFVRVLDQHGHLPNFLFLHLTLERRDSGHANPVFDFPIGLPRLIICLPDSVKQLRRRGKHPL